MGKKGKQPSSKEKKHQLKKEEDPLKNEETTRPEAGISWGFYADQLWQYTKTVASTPVYTIDWIISDMFRLTLFIYWKIVGRYPKFLMKYTRPKFLQKNEQNAEKVNKKNKRNEEKVNVENAEIVKRLENDVERLENEVKQLNSQIKELEECAVSEREMNGKITNLESSLSLEQSKCVKFEAKNMALEERLQKLIREKKILEEDKQDALRRLSEQVSVKLRDNNPNIADLNDQFRPTKLAEMFSELYDNEWTNAYALLEGPLEEEHAIVVLLGIVIEAYAFCEARVVEPWTVTTEWFLDMSVPGAQQTRKWLKDSLKATIRTKVHAVENEYELKIMAICKNDKLAELLLRKEMKLFRTKCIELCLLMVTTDPPVVLECPQWTSITQPNTSESTKDVPNKSVCGKSGEGKEDTMRSRGITLTKTHDELTDIVENASSEAREKLLFDKDLFKEYTCRGKYLDYVVWPALFLHKDGALLSKGIAQGSTEQYREEEKEEGWAWLTVGQTK